MMTSKQELELSCDFKVQRFRDLSQELEKVNKDLLEKAESLSKLNKSQEIKLAEQF